MSAPRELKQEDKKMDDVSRVDTEAEYQKAKEKYNDLRNKILDAHDSIYEKNRLKLPVHRKNMFDYLSSLPANILGKVFVNTQGYISESSGLFDLGASQDEAPDLNRIIKKMIPEIIKLPNERLRFAIIERILFAVRDLGLDVIKDLLSEKEIIRQCHYFAKLSLSKIIDDSDHEHYQRFDIVGRIIRENLLSLGINHEIYQAMLTRCSLDSLIKTYTLAGDSLFYCGLGRVNTFTGLMSIVNSKNIETWFDKIGIFSFASKTLHDETNDLVFRDCLNQNPDFKDPVINKQVTDLFNGVFALAKDPVKFFKSDPKVFMEFLDKNSKFIYVKNSDNLTSGIEMLGKVTKYLDNYLAKTHDEKKQDTLSRSDAIKYRDQLQVIVAELNTQLYKLSHHFDSIKRQGEQAHKKSLESYLALTSSSHLTNEDKFRIAQELLATRSSEVLTQYKGDPVKLQMKAVEMLYSAAKNGHEESKDALEAMMPSTVVLAKPFLLFSHPVSERKMTPAASMDEKAYVAMGSDERKQALSAMSLDDEKVSNWNAKDEVRYQALLADLRYMRLEKVYDNLDDFLIKKFGLKHDIVGHLHEIMAINMDLRECLKEEVESKKSIEFLEKMNKAVMVFENELTKLKMTPKETEKLKVEVTRLKDAIRELGVSHINLNEHRTEATRPKGLRS